MKSRVVTNDVVRRLQCIRIEKLQQERTKVRVKVVNFTLVVLTDIYEVFALTRR